jgi:hypothetical protein
VIVAESPRSLDAEILPDLSSWDIRRYGGTQVAIRTLPSAAADPEGPESAPGEGAPDAER